MNPRISTAMTHQRSVQQMQAIWARIGHLDLQMSSKKNLLTAKDDPVSADTIQRLDRSVAALDQYTKNTNNVQSRLGLQDNAMNDMVQVMTRIKDLTIQAHSGTRSDEDRQIIAHEIEQLKDSLVDLANSADGRGRYLFAGTSDAAAPFVTSGGVVTYQGDQTRRQIEIAPETFVKDTLPGSEVFYGIGPLNQSVFSVLDTLTTALNQPVLTPADQAALTAALDAGLRDVSLANDKITDLRTLVGVQQAKIETTARLREANMVALKTDLSAIEDLDLTQAIGDLNLERVALQAAQAVYMQMQSMTLLDRMR